MSKASCFLAICAVLLLGSMHGDPYPDNYFTSPLNIPLILSGGYGEMRSNHFHAGLDIKTQGRTGLPVLAAADGWVSRINVNAGGYGNALYINHPDGHQTVYAHLDAFADPIAGYVEKTQYERESFELQVFPGKNQFPVFRKDVIALSGNSGSSGGPHLHFEIRDASTAEPLNPLLFGIDVQDTVPPRIFRFKVYALDSQSTIRLRDSQTGGWRTVHGGGSAFVDVRRDADGSYSPVRVSRIEARGRIGFGIQAHDYHEGASNRLGTYRISLQRNGNLLFSSVMERFSFATTRFLNAHVDYAERRRSGRWVQRSYVLPGNDLNIYNASGRGILAVDDSNAVFNMQYTVEDAYGHTAQLGFAVHGTSYAVSSAPISDSGASTEIMHWDRTFTYATQDMSLRIPARALYDDVPFTYEKRPPLEGQMFSARHRVHDANTPLHTAMTIRLAADAVPPSLHDKVLVGLLDERGRTSSAGGGYSGGNVTTQVRTFGTFAIVADTTAPSITPLGYSRTTSARVLRLRVRDNLSGIDSFRAEIDGEWRLFNHDAKNSLFEHRLDDRTPPGEHILIVRVRDRKGNENVLELPFRK
ncbi:MAG: hypothetical protein COV99_03950 [Bacteroidetes bacterium CG12_big_fil_rev_8_21_14_0_65_60_17]|nr:MAG: hypothetical protein COV99_03950 [Bacteroidetes bacterium CG12_big_fil_rev_8_21_14_0_65_60_17]